MTLSTPIHVGTDSPVLPTDAATAERHEQRPAGHRPVLALLVLECPPSGCDFLQLAATLKESTGTWAALVAHRGLLYGAIGPQQWFGCHTGNRVVGTQAWATFYEVAERVFGESGNLTTAVRDAVAAVIDSY